MKRILVSGWIKYPHSYCYVNLEQIKVMIKEGIEVYVNERAPLNQKWIKTQGEFVKSQDYKDIMENIKVADASTIYDLSLDIAMPPSNNPFISKKKLLFMVSNYSKLTKDYISLIGGKKRLEVLFQNNDYVITPSKWSSKAIIESGNPKEKTLIIPHGVNKFDYRDKSRRESKRNNRINYKVSENKMMILVIGTPTWNKGIDILLNSIKKCKVRNNIILVIKGTDSIYNSGNNLKRLLDSYYKKENYLPKIRYIGRHMNKKEIRDLINGCDIYASLFRAEGFNLPVADAYSMNIPLLVTKAPPITEYIKQDKLIYFVDAEERIDKEGNGYFEPNDEIASKQINRAYNELIVENINDNNNYPERNIATWEEVTKKIINI